jgi:CubicO group peptidase (beta-lactamase class C family)
MQLHYEFFRPRSLSLALAVTLALPLMASGVPVAAEWPTAVPAEVGFAADLADRLDAALAGDAYRGVHSVVLVRRGKLVYERYLSGDDERLGVTKQGVVFGPESLHDIRSITKSVVGLLYGIALAQRKVPDEHTRLLSAFPEYSDLLRHPMRREISVAHALSMTMGMEWDEMNVPYSDPANSERAMYRAPDSLRFALDRLMAATPGEVWTYSGGASTLLSEIIRRGTGTDLVEYARQELFEPLGIDAFEWLTDYYGKPHAAAGLRLRPRDVARLGQLVLQSGQWEGREIVPAEWIVESTRPHAETTEGCSYGYLWWLCRTVDGVRVVEGSGWGGQQLLILPDLDLVLAVNCGLYGDPDAWRRAYGLLEEIVVPALAAE